MMGMILGNRFVRKYSVRDFVSLFSGTKTSVQDLIERIRREEEAWQKEFFPETEDEKDEEDSLSPQQKRRRELIRDCLTNDRNHTPRSMSVALGFQGVSVSPTTIWRDMQDMKGRLVARPTRPCRGKDPVVWARKRLEFCIKQKELKEHYVFVDEVLMTTRDMKKFQWCLPNLFPDAIRNPRYPATCHIFGAIGPFGFRFIRNLETFRTATSRFKGADYKKVMKELLSAMKKFYGIINRGKPEAEKIKLTIVQDGAPVHTPRVIRPLVRGATADRRNLGWKLCENWPAYSPDLNPIENCWGIAKRSLHDELCTDQKNTKTNVDRIFELAKRYFEEIPDSTIINLVDSFWDRAEACIAAEGGDIPY